MMKTRRAIMQLVILILVLAVASPAYCVLHMYEPFSYQVGDDLTGKGDTEIWEQSGAGPRTIGLGDLAPDTWVGFNSAGNHVGPDIQGKSNRLPLPLAASDLWANDGTGGTIYISAVLQGNNALRIHTEGGQLLNMSFSAVGMNAFAQYSNGDATGEMQTNLGNDGGDPKFWAWKIEHDGGAGLDNISAFITNDQFFDFTVEPIFTQLEQKQQNHDTQMEWRAEIAGGGNPSSIDELRIGDTWEDIIGFGPLPVPETLTWLADEIGLWNTARNWSPGGGPPSRTFQTAVFGDHVTVPTLVGVSSPVTVNRIEFDSDHSYAIVGLSNVNLETSTSSGATPSLAVMRGAHEFQAAVNLRADTTAGVASDSTLTFNNALNLNGFTLTQTGEGTMLMNNQLNAGGGTVSVVNGVLAGSGEIGGSLDNAGGIVSPGNSATGVANQQVPETSTLMLLGLGGLLLTYRWLTRRG